MTRRCGGLRTSGKRSSVWAAILRHPIHRFKKADSFGFDPSKGQEVENARKTSENARAMSGVLDYPNKPATTNIGSSALPRFVARVLPNGEIAFHYTPRNPSGNVTTTIPTST